MNAVNAKAGLSTSGADSVVVGIPELKPKQVNTMTANYIELAAALFKKNGAFSVGWSSHHETRPAHQTAVGVQGI